MHVALLLAMVIVPSASADEVKVVLWNGGRLFDEAAVGERANDLRQFGEYYRDADLVILDEVGSWDMVAAVRDKMGYANFHTACSDFEQNDRDEYNSLEVGLISRFPLENVVEFDRTPDNTGAPGEPAEQRLERVALSGISAMAAPRGFLTADVPTLRVTIVAVHLKSSRGAVGAADYDNAKAREYVAAAIARFVARKIRGDAHATVLVGGDMNVGETDRKKNGFRLTEDHFDAAAGDLYDETHAIFSAGLVDGLQMASLTKGLGTETYDAPQFAGAGPIDCLYVVGPRAGDFTLGQRSPQTFGSDHFAVSTRFRLNGREKTETADEPVPARTTSPIRIWALLPNPVGPDGGHEWVKLRNDGAGAVNLHGWKLRDRANNALALSGTIAPGAELKIELSDGQVPLNNAGDRIELLDESGRSVHSVAYAGAQATAGQEIRFDR